MRSPSLESAVVQRLDDLRRRPLTDLLALPALIEEALEVDGRIGKLFIYHEIVEGKHRVVLQATRERWGGLFARVVARGFEIEGENLRTLTTEELYDFT